MIYMLCRNRVKDFSKWKAVFDSHAEAAKKAGLRLINMWCSVEQSNNVFFKQTPWDTPGGKEFHLRRKRSF